VANNANNQKDPAVTDLQAQLDEARALLAAAETLNAEQAKQLADMQAQLDEAGAEGDSPKAKRGEEITPAHWKHPDYSGGLTIEQATWRKQNLQADKK